MTAGALLDRAATFAPASAKELMFRLAKSGQSAASGNLPKSARTDLSFYAVWARSLERKEDRFPQTRILARGITRFTSSALRHGNSSGGPEVRTAKYCRAPTTAAS
jgi:hypothetical protein